MKSSATAGCFKSCAGRKKKQLITLETYKMNILVEEGWSVRKLDEMKEAIRQKEDLEEETKRTYEELLEVKQSKIREQSLSSANESLRHCVKS